MRGLLLLLAGCGAPAISTIGGFSGEIDPAHGRFAIAVERPSALSPLSAVEDGRPGSGPRDTIELETRDLGSSCGAPSSFCGTVRLRSFFAAAELHDVYAEITEIVPASGHEAKNSATPPPGLSALYGLFAYGTIGAAGYGTPFEDRRWVFGDPDGAAFAFRGRVVGERFPIGCGGPADCPSGLCSAGLCAPPSSCDQLLDAGVAVSGTYTIDPDGPGGAPPIEASCSLDFGHAPGPGIAFASRVAGDYELYLMTLDGTRRITLVSEPGFDLFPTFSPDGAEIAFAAEGQIRVVDLRTRSIRNLVTTLSSASAPAWSPDGTRIAFEALPTATSNADVYVVDAAGGAPIRLTTHAAHDAGPVWSADGSRIFFVSKRSGIFDVWRMNANGTGVTQITSGSQIVGHPAASPDGAALAFARSDALGGGEIVVLDLATRAISIVTQNDDSEPAYSPDGRELVFTTARFRIPEIMRIDLATKAVTRLTNDAISDGAPVFSPIR